MSATFAPAPGAAPTARMVWAQARMESRLLLRNGEQLLLALVIPLVVLVAGTEGVRRAGLDLAAGPVDTLTPGVLALAVMSTSFTSLAIATAFERRYGVLKRLGASPLPRSGLLVGKVLALLLVELLQALVLGLVGAVLGWDPALGVAGLLGALATALVGTAAFAGLGLAMAGSLRPEGTLAAANLVYLLLLAAGAVVMPAEVYGSGSGVVSLLPSGALGEGLRTALIDGAFPGKDLLVLLVWAVLGAAVTVRTFRWE